MTGLEKITARIHAEGRERASAILQQAEQECAEIAKEYAARKKAEQEAQKNAAEASDAESTQEK